MITVHTIGGYNEVGKNMTAIELDEDIIVFDSGLFLPPIVELEERERNYTESRLRGIGAIPNDLVLGKSRNKVRAILVSHGHLDHLGAVPYIAPKYKALVAGTPFTTSILRKILQDEEINLPNKIKTVHPNSSIMIQGKKKYKVDFINITHSILQASLIAVHTNKGVILYANDFKLDNTPVVGKKPNYEAIKKLAKEGVKALIVESLYADDERKTASEKIARGLLEDVLLTTDNKNNGIIVTTFSSHIARLKSIVDFGKKLNRKVVFVGRSLNKYTGAARDVKLCPFIKDITMASYKKQVISILKKINKNRKDYVLVCTGHQGEPGSVLERMSRNELPFQFQPSDHVIFSSKTIPTEVNLVNKQRLEKRLKQEGVRIFNNVHVSGHAGREDLRDFINMVQPEHIFPAHGDLKKQSALAELAAELGYKFGKECHVMQNSQSMKIA